MREEQQQQKTAVNAFCFAYWSRELIFMVKASSVGKQKIFQIENSNHDHRQNVQPKRYVCVANC